MDRIPTRLSSMGVDAFGFDPVFMKKYLPFAGWRYNTYFRAETFGIENIPDGRVVVVCNHSGQLPFDAAMVTSAVFLEREPPRYLRSMIERFVPETPFASTFLARAGQILGTPENARRLLDNDGALLVFPEGVRGLNKTWSYRYQLQDFGQGFMRLALETGSPIIPVVVIGAEEQAPAFFNLKRVGKLFGFPVLPVTPTHPLFPIIGLLPLPTRYRIYFGKPIMPDIDANAEDPVVLKKVEEVRATMQTMIEEGLKARKNVFW
ncbi:acyltransferase family protein [Myxococcota bacterium]|nr:acyltransferase family protein [Myxococcota bacterium]